MKPDDSELPTGIRDGASSLGNFSASTSRNSRRPTDSQFVGGYLSRVSSGANEPQDANVASVVSAQRTGRNGRRVTRGGRNVRPVSVFCSLHRPALCSSISALPRKRLRTFARKLEIPRTRTNATSCWHLNIRPDCPRSRRWPEGFDASYSQIAASSSSRPARRSPVMTVSEPRSQGLTIFESVLEVAALFRRCAPENPLGGRAANIFVGVIVTDRNGLWLANPASRQTV